MTQPRSSTKRQSYGRKYDALGILDAAKTISFQSNFEEWLLAIANLSIDPISNVVLSPSYGALADFNWVRKRPEMHQPIELGAFYPG